MKAANMKQFTMLVPCVATTLLLAACGGGGGDGMKVSYDTAKPFVVGTTTYDPKIQPEPKLPTEDQVCATLVAGEGLNLGTSSAGLLKKRPDGALAPEADPVVAGVRKAVSKNTANPDQDRIQAALDACGASVYAEVGGAIEAADAAAAATEAGPQKTGATGEELDKPQYKATKYAVRLVVNPKTGEDSFISGPLTLPSGVTLWIDKGVTLFATRDVKAYLTTEDYGSTTKQQTNFCAGTASINAAGASQSGSSSNCKALFNGDYLVNSAIVGDGSIDSRAYAEIVTTDANYPLMKVDLTCSNTFAAYRQGKLAAQGESCDNGGTTVDLYSSVRNMTWWDLAFKGNMVDNGQTGSGSQSNFRMMVFNYAKNLTLYRITMNNSANFHLVPSGIDGLTIWGIKIQTPSLAAFANPAGNANPLYNGDTFNEDNVKNTDAIDPGSASGYSCRKYTIGKGKTSGNNVCFDGYLKNLAVVYNYVSTGDDDIVLKGSSAPLGATSYQQGEWGVDGNRGKRSDRAYGINISHNHIYWGHGISVGSETNVGVRNVHVYDNSFNGAEEGLRIKSDYARGGDVSNMYYDNICIKNTLNALLFTPYYSTRPQGSIPEPRIPIYHDIYLNNVRIQGHETQVKLMGFAANEAGTNGNPQYPLIMSLKNVVADPETKIEMISSDANLTLNGVNLPIQADVARRIQVSGRATMAVDPAKAVDCSRAYVDFPTLTYPGGTTW